MGAVGALPICRLAGVPRTFCDARRSAGLSRASKFEKAGGCGVGGE